MDVLGTVVNVAHIARRVVEFIRDAREAPAERERLVLAVFSASGVIETFRILYASSTDAPWRKRIAEAVGPSGAVIQYRKLLERILDKALTSAGNKSSAMKKIEEGWKNVKWPFDKKALASLIGEVDGLKSSLLLILSDVQIEMGMSMESTLVRLESKVDSLDLGQSEMLRGQKVLLNDHSESKLEDLCRWLCMTNAQQQLRGSLRAFENSKPLWYLQDECFQNWEAARSSSRMLWCPGRPGAGKTVFASFLAHELRQRHTGADSAVAVFFCNYKSHQSDEQSAGMILRSMCRQFLEQKPALRPFIEKYRRRLDDPDDEEEDEEPIEDEQQLVTHLASQLKSSFIIIDALDECDDRQKTFLMRQLHNLLADVPSVRLLITSRHNQQHLFSDAPSMDIEAKDEDIENFLQSRMDHMDALSALVELPADNLSVVRKRIIERSFGLFLIAKGHMDALEECERKDTLRTRLDNLSGNQEGIYDDAWSRIVEQKEDRRILGTTAILWIVRARRILTSAELLHAVAVSTYDSERDFDNSAVASERLLLASCGGLIIINPDTKLVTIHQSLQEYFERRGKKTFYFPRAEEEMAKVCLKYLCLGRFSEGHCKNKASYDNRIRENAFFEYAAQNWGWHLREAGTPDLVEQFNLLQSEQILASATQALTRSPVRVDGLTWPNWLAPNFDLDWFPNHDKPILPALHLVAYFGLTEVMTGLLRKEHLINEMTEDGRTALYVASCTGSVATVKLLLDQGADLNIGNKRGITPLHVAASSPHNDVVECMLNHSEDKAQALANKKNWLGRTPLHDATSRGHAQVVRALLRAGADPCMGDDNREHQETPMHYAVNRGYLELISELYGCTQGGRKTLEVRTQKFQHTPIHAAIVYNQTEAFRLLVKLGASIESRQWTGGTPFYQACEFGRIHIVNDLMNIRADVRACDNWGKTGLHMASANGHLHVVQIILHRIRAPDFINKQGNVGNTALLKSIGNSSNYSRIFQSLINSGADMTLMNDDRDTALHLAAKANALIIVNTILARPEGKAMLEKHTKPTGHTPLHEAVVKGHVTMVRKLLDAGADMRLVNNDEDTVLHLAAKQNALEIVNMLLERPEITDVLEKQTKWMKYTPLHEAIVKGHVGMVRRLVEAGAGLKTGSYSGNSALEVAQRQEQHEIIDFLKSLDV